LLRGACHLLDAHVGFMLADYAHERGWFGNLGVTSVVGLPAPMCELVQPAVAQMNQRQVGDAEIAVAREVARRIQHSHMVTDHHWADTGQHFTISRGGLILEGRHGSREAARAGRVVEGAHAVSSDGSANRTWFGIEIEGDNRQADRVTAPQYSALVELCALEIQVLMPLKR